MNHLWGFKWENHLQIGYDLFLRLPEGRPIHHHLPINHVPINHSSPCNHP